jgi:uncharacterized protein
LEPDRPLSWGDRAPVVPPCRDPFDLPFRYLAIAGRAHALVSGDKDLLALADTRGLCPVLSVEAFCRQLPVAAA